MTNPFAIIPAKVRLWLYLAYALAGLILSAVSAYAVATQATAPAWVGGVAAVLVVIGTAFGFTAASNVAPESNSAVIEAPATVELTTTEYRGEHREGGESAVNLLIGVLAIVVLVLLILRIV